MSGFSDSGRPDMPVRPYLPPSFAGAVSAILHAALLLELVWRSCMGEVPFAVPRAACTLVFACGTAVLGIALYRGRNGCALPRGVMWAAACTATAALACGIWAGAMAGKMEGLVGSPAQFEFVVRGDATLTARGALCAAVARRGSAPESVRVRMSLPRVYADGTRLRVVGRFVAWDGSDWARSCFMRGEAMEVQALKVLSADPPEGFDPVRDARARAIGAIGPERDAARALAAGVLCGYRTALGQTDVRDAFAAAGLSHLVAVSGSHLAVVAALWSRVLRRCRMPLRATQVVGVAVLALYVLFCGCSVSAVRAALMSALALAAGMSGRRGHALSALSLAALALVLLDPGVVFDLGFELSVLSVLFICVFQGYAERALGAFGLPRALAGPAAVTLCAQVATIPVTAAVFGSISFAAPLANLLAAPLVSGLVAYGLVALPLACALPSLPWFMAPVDALARATLFCARAFAGLPYASVAVPPSALLAPVLYGGAVALYAFWPRIARGRVVAFLVGVLSIAVVPALRWMLFAPPGITVLDVGQADAILVRDGAAAVLVDAGVDDSVVAALARNHVYRLDAVVITHWDRDHWGGLPALLRAVPVGRVYAATDAVDRVPVELKDDVLEPPRPISRGDVLEVGSFRCKAIWPGDASGLTENAASLVFCVQFERDGAALRALLTGDSELEQERAYARQAGDVDLLKLGHHGSAVSVDAELLDELDPEVCVASAGENNRYGHPTAACVNAVREHGSLFACTKDVGDVTVQPGAEGVRVSVSRSVPLAATG